ncbi:MULTISPECIES: ABC transporter permease [Lactobacillus]|uniref:ABC transporter permease n=1 Tax=Lactobacillus xujianguonis TaxID=2495899 RepID=A0A437SVL9_9LACO|nr:MULTISPECIES: ABC transporter permease [Lactobacillus]RVU70887.1 ABC transporter permease [Lactobacillus xujianguonis]RVU73766.1 ABC transporter permease [Lactobacillus xujianguonis]
MNKTLLVAKETYRREVKSWSYLAMVIGPFIFLAISFLVGYFTSSSSSDTDYVGVVTQVKELKPAFKDSDDFENYASLAKAKQALKNDDIDGYVEIKEDDGQLQADYHASEKLDDEVKAKLLQKLQGIQQVVNLQQAKLTEAQQAALQIKPVFHEKVIKEKASGEVKTDSPQYLAFFALIIILYMLIMTYTQVTAQDIATEKGTKIMEMIFSSMPGKTYFDGKIIGIIGEIITQVVIYALGGVAFYLAAPQLPGIGDAFKELKPVIDQVLAGFLSWSLVFAVLGLILYVVCAAFCGALASKPEDANKAVQPVSYLAIIGFFAAMFLQNSPTSLASRILSYVPFFSSYVMPLRVINGNATNLEAAISAVILLAFLAALMILIRSIYPNLILQTDDRGLVNNFKRALKSK